MGAHGERGKSDAVMCREMTSGVKPRGRIPKHRSVEEFADGSEEGPVMGLERSGDVVPTRT